MTDSTYTKCPACSTLNRADATACYNCKQPLDPSSQGPETRALDVKDVAGKSSADAVRVIAWLSLLGGILMGMGFAFRTSESDFGVGIGLMIVVQAVAFFVLSLALAAAAENSAALRLELAELRGEIRGRASTGPIPGQDE